MAQNQPQSESDPDPEPEPGTDATPEHGYVEDYDAKRPKAVTQPPTHDFWLQYQTAIAATSSHCEICGGELDGTDLDDFIVGMIEHNDFRLQNFAAMHRVCYIRTDDWREDVLAARDDPSTPERFIGWLMEPHARLLFWRRLLVGTGALAIAVLMMGLVAAGLGIERLSPGSLIGAAGAFSSTAGVIAGMGVVAAYGTHLRERERNDPRGTSITAADLGLTDAPWLVLWIGGGVMAVTASTVLFTTVADPTPRLARSIAAVGYIIASGVVIQPLERAVRADRCHDRIAWTPRYDQELFALRVVVVVGVVAMLPAVIGHPPASPMVIGQHILFAPPVALAAYLYYRTWHDLGDDWGLFGTPPKTDDTDTSGGDGS